jgi:hypothetical protein
MHRTFEIVGSAILSITGLVFIVWLFVRTLKRSEDPLALILKWAITVPLAIFGLAFAARLGPYGPPLVAVFGIIIAIIWAPHIGALVSKPLSSLYDGGGVEPEPKPFYSIAQTRRKQGKIP